ncbi:hypothetical protein [Bosea thiooxidans]
MPRFLFLLPALMLGACAYHTSRSSVVVVTDAKGVVENCTDLGKIDGQSELQAIMPLDKSRDSVISRLKIRAAEMGGTHVLASVADVKWKGPDATGTVYKCGNR